MSLCGAPVPSQLELLSIICLWSFCNWTHKNENNHWKTSLRRVCSIVRWIHLWSDSNSNPENPIKCTSETSRLLALHVRLFHYRSCSCDLVNVTAYTLLILRWIHVATSDILWSMKRGCGAHSGSWITGRKHGSTLGSPWDHLGKLEPDPVIIKLSALWAWSSNNAPHPYWRINRSLRIRNRKRSLRHHWTG